MQSKLIKFTVITLGAIWAGLVLFAFTAIFFALVA